MQRKGTERHAQKAWSPSFWRLLVSCIILSNLTGCDANVETIDAMHDQVIIGNAETIIKRYLKTPDTYARKDATIVWHGKTKESKDAYMVNVTYSAQNLMGAILRQCSLVTFYVDGDQMKWREGAAVNGCWEDSPQAREIGMDEQFWLEFIASSNGLEYEQKSSQPKQQQNAKQQDRPARLTPEPQRPKEHDEEEEEHKQAFYSSLAPAFVVNFQGKDSKARFLKVELDVVTRDEEYLKSVETHMPKIRNNLVLLFSRQIYEDIISHEGKERLRAEALAEIQKVLKKETGKKAVEEVFFTSFVMQ